MRLTGEQFLQLQSALLKAFPRRDDLRLMVRVRLQINLDEIIEGRNLTEAVSGLITWAEDRDQIEELLRKAHQHNPGNDSLKMVAESLPAAIHAPPQDGAARWQIRNQQLDSLFNDFGIDLLVKGAKRVRSRSRRAFKEQLFPAHQLFGGRSVERASLAGFVGSISPGYFFITGPSGLGKTALLTNFAHELETRQIGTALAFITPMIDASEKYCLQSLCEQLLVFHELGGEIPEREFDIGLLYADLLRLPPPLNQRIVVIMDGLDEAIGSWSQQSSLYPQDVAEGVQVIVSAREMADKDWLKELGLVLPAEQVIRLGLLRLDEIRDVLPLMLPEWEESRLEQTAERLYELSEGDPFYLHILLEDVRKDPNSLEKPPVGLDNYLKDWWVRGGQQGGEQAFADLMGTLWAARAPLNRRELIDLSSQDTIQSQNFDRLIAHGARYIVGSEEDGYQISHNRIRLFVEDRLADVLDTYRHRLADYCLRWKEQNQTVRELNYRLQHAAIHLSQMGRRQELLDLLSPDWISAKWRHFGSYSDLIRDYDTAIFACMDEPVDYAAIGGLAIARQTARDIMLNFPVELLEAWVRFGEAERAVALIKSLDIARGQAAAPMTTLASSLLDMAQKDPSPQALALRQMAVDLLGSAQGMLPLIRTDAWRLERMAQITNLMHSRYAIPTVARKALLEQGRRFAESLRERVLRLSAMGLVAEALASESEGLEAASDILDHALSELDKIKDPTNRLLVLAYLMPAMELVDPLATLPALQKYLALGKSALKGSALDGSPLVVLLERWIPYLQPKKEGLIELMQETGKLALRSETETHFIREAGQAVRALLKVGEQEAARQALREIWDDNPPGASVIFLKAATEMKALDPDWAGRWMQRARRALGTSNLGKQALALAEFGLWEDSVNALRSAGENVNDELLQVVLIAGERLSDDLPRLNQIMSSLDDLCEQLAMQTDPKDSAEFWARLFATKAMAEATNNMQAARGWADRAAFACLGELPEGDLTELYKMLALMFQEQGRIPEAIAELERIQWPSAVIETIVQMAVAETHSGDSASVNKAALGSFAESALGVMAQNNENPESYSVMEACLTLADVLCEPAPQAALQLLDYIQQTPGNTALFCAQAAIRCRLDLPAGLRDLRTELESLTQYNRGEGTSIEILTKILGQLAKISGLAPASVLELIQETYAMASKSASPLESIELNCAYGVALASQDVAQVAQIIGAQVEKIPTLEQEGSSVLSFIRLVSDLTGSKVGRNHKQARAASEIARAAAALVVYQPNLALQILDSLLDQINIIESLEDRAQGLAYLFKHCCAVQTGFQPLLAELYGRARRHAAELEDELLSDYALSKAVEALCEAGLLESARQAAALIRDAERRNRSQDTTVRIAERRLQLGAISILEKAYLSQQSDVAYIILSEMRATDLSEELLNTVIQLLADPTSTGKRYYQLDMIHVMLLPAYWLGGVELAAKIVRRIEDFDQRFLRAAALIAA